MSSCGREIQLRKLISILTAILMVFSISACSLSAATAEVSTQDAPFSITMLNVGQGLSLLIKADGHYMLYDGGGRDYSSYVVSYMKKHGVNDFDYLVASHYDDDHINGLVGVLNTAKVKKALLPDYTADTRVYRSLQQAVQGIPVVHPTRGSTYTLGKAKITVISPANYHQEIENNNSIALRIQYGNFSAIMTGDAEQEAESAMLSSGLPLKSDLYVVGHHGSSSSSSRAFLRAIQPSYAFLSVGPYNKYGHPTQKMLNTLKSFNVNLFRTDKQGEVTAYSNGKKCWFNKRPTTDWSPGDAASSQAVYSNTPNAGQKTSTQYVINKNSKKFHRPDCPSVQQMKAKNREYTNASRDTLIKQGYTPCANCKP